MAERSRPVRRGLPLRRFCGKTAHGALGAEDLAIRDVAEIMADGLVTANPSMLTLIEW